jgi:hypothetical protein
LLSTFIGLLFSSWRFFEEAGEAYSVEFSVLDPELGWSSWHDSGGFWIPRNKRVFCELFFAPHETYRLWKVSQLNRFIFFLQTRPFNSEEVQNIYLELENVLLPDVLKGQSQVAEKWRFSVVGSQSGRIFESEPFAVLKEPL